MSAVNAQSPKTSNNTLQTTLQNLAKNRTSSIDSNNSSSDLRNNHHNTGGSKEEIWEGSLHSYHAWLKEKQKEEEEKKKTNPVSSLSNNNYKFTTTTSTSATTPGSSVKDEDEEEEEVNQDDSSYQVDDIMERGPSPPENNENSNSYEWSYEEQFKQVKTPSFIVFNERATTEITSNYSRLFGRSSEDRFKRIILNIIIIITPIADSIAIRGRGGFRIF